MLRKLVYPHPENKDQPVLEMFLGKTYPTIEDFIVLLKASKIKDKRYQSMHTFAKLCVDTYKPVPPLTELVFGECIRMFKDIEYRFIKRCVSVPYFNYNWLLKKLLHHLGITRYDPYLKTIKCKKRKQYYEDMFNSLCTTTSIPGGDQESQQRADAIEGGLLTNLFQSITSQRLSQDVLRDIV
jgi:hypothetical protein